MLPYNNGDENEDILDEMYGRENLLDDIMPSNRNNGGREGLFDNIMSSSRNNGGRGGLLDDIMPSNRNNGRRGGLLGQQPQPGDVHLPGFMVNGGAVPLTSIYNANQTARITNNNGPFFMDPSVGGVWRGPPVLTGPDNQGSGGTATFNFDNRRT